MMKSVCVQCRIRKVRCKGEQPACSNCRRLKFTCSFQRMATDPSSITEAFGMPHKCRNSRACIPCHSQKTRCLGERPACANCQRRGRHCIYRDEEAQNVVAADIVGTRSSRIPGTDDSSQPLDVQAEESNHDLVYGSEGTLNTTCRVSELISMFFERLFPLPSYSFLHPATVKRRCQQGVLNEPLKFTICAITTLYVRGRSPSSDGWANEGQKLLLQNLSWPSVLHLQALLLLVRYRAGAGEFSSAFLLAGLAARSAVGLRLNYERSDFGPIAQEVRRRTFWSLYLLDDIFSVGLKDFELCQADIIHLQLPSEDIEFIRERYVSTGPLEFNENERAESIGFRGLFLRITSIRRAIMRLNRKIHSGSFDPSTLAMSVEIFSKKLRTVEAHLKSLDMSTLINIPDDRWDPSIVMSRLSLQQCYCDLYRIFLTGYPEAASQSATEQVPLQEREYMQNKCLHHAHTISQLFLDFAGRRDETQVLDYDAAVCAYHSLRLMLFGVSTRPRYSNTERQAVIERTEACVNVITRLFHFLEPVKPMIVDIERLLHYTTTSTLAICSTHTIVQAPKAVKVAKEASARQRLSIHSLLHQADFVDDSSQAADSATYDTNQISYKTNRADNIAGSATRPSYLSIPAHSTTYKAPPSLIYNAWMGFPSMEDPAEQLDSFTEDF